MTANAQKTLMALAVGATFGTFGAGVGAAAAAAKVIYQDNFNRTGSLNALTPSPTDTAGATWTAGTSITTTAASGGHASLTSTSSMAYLSFTPVSGNIYILTASLNPTPGTTTNWLALGFFPQSASSVGSAPDAAASAMVLERDNRGSQVFNGDGASANGPTSPNSGYTKLGRLRSTPPRATGPSVSARSGFPARPTSRLSPTADPMVVRIRRSTWSGLAPMLWLERCGILRW